jgi:hypothetical protein
MSGFLDQLEEQLTDAVHRHAAGAPGRAATSQVKPRRAPARSRRRAWLGVIGALLLAGSATAAVLVSRSHPLQGTIRGVQGILGVPTASYQVHAFPYLAVGWSGWCASVAFQATPHRSFGDYSCGAVEASDDPLIAGGDTAGGPGDLYDFGFVSTRVAAIRLFNGTTIVPIANAHLPSWMRAYIAFVRGRPPLRIRPDTLLDHSGHTIPQPTITRANAVEHLPTHAINPNDAGAVPCAVRERSSAGIAPLAQTVSTVAPWPRPQPGAFLACANATFRVDGTTLAVAVLVNANAPDQGAPPLPELAPLSGQAGLLGARGLGTIGFPEGAGVADFSGHATTFAIPAGQQQFGAPAGILLVTNHDVTARRDGLAWLIAQGGTGAQRARLLATLTVTGSHHP